MTTLIKNGKIINSDHIQIADIFIKDGKIKSIAPRLNLGADKIIDASNKYIIPGGIDVHTHLDMPYGSISSTDDFETGTIAAAFGGTTSIIDFATQFKGQSLIESWEVWQKKAQTKAVIDYGFHMIITDVYDGVLGEMDQLVAEGISSFKLFMAYPGNLMLDDKKIFKIMQQAHNNGALVMMHAENGNVIDVLVEDALSKGNVEPIYHALTRPPVLEGEATNRTIALAKAAGVPCYIVHVTCNEALQAIAAARSEEQPVFGETCPHYLVLNEMYLREPGLEGAKYVLSPPLRESWHQEKLWNGLNNNDLQIVSTDHCPFNLKGQKEMGKNNFTKIPNGGPGIENRLHITFEAGVNRNKISLQKWVELNSTNPAKLFGLYPEKGVISEGSDADVVIWDPFAEHIISAETHHMRVDYNMYEGFVVRGNAEIVISRGDVIIENGKFIGEKGRGRFLKRKKFKLWN